LLWQQQPTSAACARGEDTNTEPKKGEKKKAKKKEENFRSHWHLAILSQHHASRIYELGSIIRWYITLQKTNTDHQFMNDGLL
jgi:hypothetical protein